jgi:tRNA U55 pseudouridine synthase TruB
MQRMGTSRTEAFPKGAFFKIDESTKFLFEEGQLLLIDKPIHWTSFDVVKKFAH